MVVFYTLIRGWIQKKCSQTFQILLFRSSAIILPTKNLQELTFSCHGKMLMSTLCHSGHMKHTKMATVTLLDFMLMTISLNLKCLVNKTLKNFGKLGNCKVRMDESYPWHLFPPTIKLPITQIIYPLIYISEFLLLNWVPYLSPLHPHICMRLQVRHYSVGLSSLLQFIN